MRLLLLFILMSFQAPKTIAATPQALMHTQFNDSVSTSDLPNLLSKQMQALTAQKMNLVQRLQWKILQKKFKKLLPEVKDQKSKDTLSTIALVSGVAGFVLLFLFPLVGFLLLLNAIITGFVARKNNENPKSRKKALIGLILGLVAYALIFVFAIVYAGGFG